MDESRPEEATESTWDHREVTALVWYPAEADTGTPSKYFADLDRLEDTLRSSGEVSWPEILGLRLIIYGGRENAALPSSPTTFPVIILSPGHYTNVQFYSGIADELASQGYVVFGINHPYDSAAVALANGQVAKVVEGPLNFEARQPWITNRIAVRVGDVRFVLDRIEELNAPGNSLFTGRLDLAKVGIIGHSLGGITAAQACIADPRLKACINLDGVQPGGAFSTVRGAPPCEQPFMMITKEKTLPEPFIEQFNAVKAGAYRVILDGAKHDNFSDGPVLMPSLLPGPNKADQILALTRKYTVAFLYQNLNGRPSDVLAKPTQDSQSTLEIFPPKQ